MKVYEIIDQLKVAKGGNAKKAILLENKDNADLANFFKYALTNNINFWIRQIPAYEQSIVLMSTSEIFAQLDILTRREKTGSAAKEHLAQLLSNLDVGDQELVKKIIAKDPRCGVSVGSANRTWPGLIEVWPCHKCSRYNEKNMANILYPAIIQEKSDGMRINPIVKNDSVEIKSISGNPLTLFGYLDEPTLRLAAIMGVDTHVFDGEGLVVDEDGNIMPRKKGNGILNKAIRGTISKEEASRVRLNLWNHLPIDSFFNKKKDGTPYITALRTLAEAIVELDDPRIVLIDSKTINNIDEAHEFYQGKLKENKEGAVIKNFNSVWENARSKFQVKMKIEDPADLRIVECYDHRTKPGQIGGFILTDATGVLEVRCGSGLKDIDRVRDPNYYIDKIVAIKYNEIIDSDSKPGKKSLFLPIIDRDSEDCIRLDKIEPDSLHQNAKGKWALK